MIANRKFAGAKLRMEPKTKKTARHVHGSESQRIWEAACAEEPLVINDDGGAEYHPHNHPHGAVHLFTADFDPALRWA